MATTHSSSSRATNTAADLEMKAAYANPQVVGDPARVAEAVIAAATDRNPPARLPLREMSVGATRAKLARVAADMDRMESVALGVHCPTGASLHKAAAR
jgi:hypothetical protein